MEKKTLGIVQLVIGIILLALGIYVFVWIPPIPETLPIVRDVDLIYLLTGLFAIFTAIPNLKK